MPSMSDFRRGVDKIVPDSLRKYLPDSIETTIGDKAISQWDSLHPQNFYLLQQRQLEASRICGQSLLSCIASADAQRN